jgi:hypothetical protein
VLYPLLLTAGAGERNRPAASAPATPAAATTTTTTTTIQPRLRRRYPVTSSPLAETSPGPGPPPRADSTAPVCSTPPDAACSGTVGPSARSRVSASLIAYYLSCGRRFGQVMTVSE